MNPEQRFVLAMLLSFGVIFLWSLYTTQKYQPLDNGQKVETRPSDTKEREEQNDKQGKENDTTEDKDEQGKENGTTEDKDEQGKENDTTEDKDEQAVAKDEQFITMDTEHYRMVWSNRGASLISLKLKKFVRNKADKTLENWQQREENWLEVLPNFTSKTSSLRTFADIDASQDKLASGLWAVKEQTEDRLVFEIGPIAGIKYRKILQFGGEKYFDGELVVENVGEQSRQQRLSLAGSAGIAWESRDNEVTRFVLANLKYRSGDNNDWEDFAHGELLDEDSPFEYSLHSKKNLSWAWGGLVNRYFAAVLEIKTPQNLDYLSALPVVPESEWIEKTKAERKHRGEHISIEELDSYVKSDTLKLPMLVFTTKALDIAAGEKHKMEFRFHVDTRASLNDAAKFQGIEDFGWFSLIARGLLSLLQLLYNIFGNYGVAIICMTLLVKLCLFPITKKQQSALQDYQKAMKKIQPQLVQLQEKYKNNRQKLNEEIMALYKRNNVNPIPVAGCLPMFLQLPIFIGLYNALLYSVMLREQSFLWIADLAQPDQLLLFGPEIASFFSFLGLGDYFNILPIIMTVVWILQQKLMPKPEDPQAQQQQKMFMFMTIFFGWMFYNVAAGLVLYWMVMNMFAICEQLIIKKYRAATT